MKLTASLTSPYARKIRILLAEKHIPFELVVDSPWETATSVPALNPLGKVPVLETDEGETFFDSPVIAGFLEALDHPPHLIPQDNMSAVRVRQTEALADGILDAAVLAYLETLRPAEARMASNVARQHDKIERALIRLEAQLTGDWFHGERISLADIAVGCALEYLDLRAPELKWRERHPRLKAFLAKLGARDSFVDTRPPG
ncbi:glutathione S-transferase [Denitromonas iodatirespirans]|uniref:Glutathione S-transferase n=1 Tax=Denitromonas iodatirespirans TaxID=2795389 RepID=A0A944HA71_DENI1|nr:glutathione S-transferase [Denitromonas iodatirespirans]MBT0963175.1 glutathione S-transferase [Denitromonas iodatirespirans]